MTKKYPNSRIIVFAREPRLGQVKTRLASTIGDNKALALYTAMLTRVGTLLEASDLANWDLWVTSNSSHESFLSICKQKNIYLQKGKDLGQRMDFALSQTLHQEPIESVLIIGSDCPALEASYLNAALEALDSGIEIVIGPAADGGYVLIGSRQAIPELFSKISWGSDQVLAETRQRLVRHGLSYTLLETLWDVDRPEDLLRLEQLNPPLTWG